jgi:hypothetical protein
MAWLALLGAFFAFMASLGAVHALDRHAARRYGYRPFALPNLAFMLIPHGALLAWLGWIWAFGAEGDPSGTGTLAGLAMTPALVWILGAIGAAAALFMLLVLYRRTGPWIALAATLAMTLAASVLIPSMLFRDLAETPPHE